MVKVHFGLGWVMICAALLGSVGCDVESTDASTGGVDDGDDDDDDDGETLNGDAGADAGADAIECPRGVSIVLSDYLSTQIALSDLEGTTRSSSFVSTASSETAGLAFALSGDVSLPSTAPASGRIVLLDRFGTNVITFMDPRSAEALGQLAVGTGFESNPQDYLEIGDGIALVSRWGQNADPGNEAFDTGGDVLVVDTETFEVIDAIELPVQDDLPPRPSRLSRLGNSVIVNLDRVATDFATTGEAMWASISVDDWELEWVLPLEGFKECGRLAMSPDGSRVAMACTGAIAGDGTIEDIDQSALMILDPEEHPPRVLESYSAEELVGEPLQDSVEYASDDVILFKTQTPLGGATNNRWFALTLSSGDVSELVEANADDETGGKGIVYGAMLCAPGCSNVCLMTDADEGVLQRIQIDVDGDVTLLDPVEVESSVGLVPRTMAHR